MSLANLPPRQKVVRCVSNIIRQSAKGEQCTARMPWCNRNPETTVFCHIRKFGFAGFNIKPQDLHGFYGCSECHSRENEMGFEDLLRAMMETQTKLWEKGILKV